MSVICKKRNSLQILFFEDQQKTHGLFLARKQDMAKKVFYAVIPFNGNAERKASLIKSKGIRSGKNGQILILDQLFENHGNNRIHLPTELLSDYEEGKQYLLVRIAEKGMSGKRNPYKNIPHAFFLSQLIIEPEFLEKTEIATVDEKLIAQNLTAKLRIMSKD